MYRVENTVYTYICTPPFVTITAGSDKIGFIRILSNRRSNKYDGLPQIALSNGFAFFCPTALDQTSAEVTCRSAGYQRMVQYDSVNVTGPEVHLGVLITRANCSGDELNLKSCALTLGEEQCEDNALQYIECDSPAEEVPSLGEAKPTCARVQLYWCTRETYFMAAHCVGQRLDVCAIIVEPK